MRRPQVYGNAVDTALATSMVLNVTLPMMTGLGGDVFALIYEAKTGKVTGIGASGLSGAGAHPELFVERSYERMPLDGPLSVAVPGAMQAYEDIHRSFCAMEWERLIEPARRYAEQGFPLPRWTANQIHQAAGKLRRFPETAGIFLKGGEAPKPGDLLVRRIWPAPCSGWLRRGPPPATGAISLSGPSRP